MNKHFEYKWEHYRWIQHNKHGIHGLDEGWR